MNNKRDKNLKKLYTYQQLFSVNLSDYCRAIGLYIGCPEATNVESGSHFAYNFLFSSRRIKSRRKVKREKKISIRIAKDY